jgi:tripartite ATP-independent transporter DctM subunit
MLMFAAMIYVRVKLNPNLAPPVRETFSRQEKLEVLAQVWPLPVLILSVLVGIFIGLFTPTEAGAVGAALAILIAFLRKSLSWSVIKSSISLTLSGTASIFMVVIGTVMLGKFLALSGLPAFITESFLSTTSSELGVIIAVAALYLILGCFLDSIGLLLLTLPIILPLAKAVGIDLIYFAIILVKLLELGLVTPPVGLNVYVTKSALGNLVSLPTIFRGVSWFIVADLITLSLLIAFPIISLYLPGLMD